MKATAAVIEGALHGGGALFIATHTEVYRQDNRSNCQKSVEQFNVRHQASPRFLLL